jgi:hypothetical protein
MDLPMFFFLHRLWCSRNRLFNVAIFVALGLLGLAAQFFSQPRRTAKASVVPW